MIVELFEMERMYLVVRSLREREIYKRYLGSAYDKTLESRHPK